VQFEVGIEHADQALEHLTSGARVLAQRHLGGELLPEMALLLGERHRFHLAQELGKHAELVHECDFQRIGDRLDARLHPAQELLGAAQPLAEIRQRQAME
jgi:hypothetical protein